MRVKNVSGVTKVYVGQTLTNNQEYDIPNSDLFKWQDDSTVIADLAALTLLIGDGVTYKSTASEATKFLLEVDSTPKDASGRPLSRIATTVDGWHYQPHWVEFETSKLGSVYNKNESEADLGFTTIKFYDSNNAELTEQAAIDSNCVKTVVTWMPTHDYEIIAAKVFQTTTPNTDVRFWVVGLPGIANIRFAQGGINLRFLGLGAAVDTDGRSSKYLKYNNPIPGTNKFQVVLIHNAGLQHKVAMLWEIYKAP